MILFVLYLIIASSSFVIFCSSFCTLQFLYLSKISFVTFDALDWIPISYIFLSEREFIFLIFCLILYSQDPSELFSFPILENTLSWAHLTVIIFDIINLI